MNDEDMTPEEVWSWPREGLPTELNVSSNLRRVVVPDGFRVTRGPRTWAAATATLAVMG